MSQTLFISNLVPWPLDSGGNIRIYHQLRAVAAESDVTLVCFTPDEAATIPGQIRDMVREVHTISRQTCRYVHRANMSPLRRRAIALTELCACSEPEIVRSWRSPDAVELARRLRKRTFDLVWGEHLGSVNIASQFNGVRRILDMYDVEHSK